MKGIKFPADHQYVIIDTSETPKFKTPRRLPMIFWIDYSRVSGGSTALNTPELTMLINPDTMTLNFSKKISPVFARDGYVIEEWGEDLDVIQCSGKIGGYYIKEGSQINSIENNSGLSRYHRNKSLSFKNIYKLLYIFRNNGAIFQNTTKDTNKRILMQDSGYTDIETRVPEALANPRNRIDRVGDVYMSYDSTTYVGSFDSFSMKEDANSPYTLAYSFQFTVQRRSTEDFRKIKNYNQASFENSDVSKNTDRVKMIMKTAINIQKEASIAEQSNLSVITKSKVDKPIPNGSNASAVSTSQLVQRGVALLRSNFMNPTVADRDNYTKAIEVISLGREQKSYFLEHSGRQSLVNSINETAKREGRWTEAEAISRSNNLAEEMIKDLPKP